MVWISSSISTLQIFEETFILGGNLSAILQDTTFLRFSQTSEVTYYDQLQTYYDHDCLENFLLIFIVFYLQLKISHVLARKASSF